MSYICRKNPVMKRQRYPVSTSSFEKIRKGDYLYVDKTEYVYSLISDPGFYFLARPRRFGKSLLISTLEAFYKGEQELFKGLNIYSSLSDYKWDPYPVLHFDLSATAYMNNDSLIELLDTYLLQWEKKYEMKTSHKSVYQRLSILLETIYEKESKGIVILIDEYDSPLTNTIGNEPLQDHYREQLHGFYSILKAKESKIHFCMLTGVSKFGKISVFNGINNIRDISFSDTYAGVCGITEAELNIFFSQGIEELATHNGWNLREAFEKLKFNYEGYHFSKILLDIYNPYSLLYAIANKEISNYWSSSGIPTLLSKSIVDLDYNLKDMNGASASQEMLENISIYKKDPVALFYQTGYLTIKGYDRTSEIYILGYPNREVENGILSDILSLYLPEQRDVNVSIIFMRNTLCEGNPKEFINILKAFLAGIPSRLRTNVGQYENYYHTIFYCITSLIGLNVEAEYNTSGGFIDILIKTAEFIYVIELKINGDAKDALNQIEKKDYAAQFTTDTRVVYKIGIGFSKKTHNIDSYIIETRPS